MSFWGSKRNEFNIKFNVAKNEYERYCRFMVSLERVKTSEGLYRILAYGLNSKLVPIETAAIYIAENITELIDADKLKSYTDLRPSRLPVLPIIEKKLNTPEHKIPLKVKQVLTECLDYIYKITPYECIQNKYRDLPKYSLEDTKIYGATGEVICECMEEKWAKKIFNLLIIEEDRKNIDKIGSDKYNNKYRRQ